MLDTDTLTTRVAKLCNNQLAHCFSIFTYYRLIIARFASNFALETLVVRDQTWPEQAPRTDNTLEAA
jgi:hypothetical protein